MKAESKDLVFSFSPDTGFGSQGLIHPCSRWSASQSGNPRLYQSLSFRSSCTGKLFSYCNCFNEFFYTKEFLSVKVLLLYFYPIPDLYFLIELNDVIQPYHSYCA